MPYQRMKEDNFQIFGGINQKASQADLSVLEFLDISNMDFTATGALQQKPGTTYLIGATNAVLNATTVIGYFGTTQQESGSTFPYGGYVGTLAIQTGSTFIGPTLSSIYEFSNLQGASFILFSGLGAFSYGNSLPQGATFFTLSQIFFVTGTSFGYVLDPAGNVTGATNAPQNSNWCFQNFVNRVFFCNGDNFFKWDGYTVTSIFTQLPGTSNIVSYYPSVPSAYKYCLPPGTSLFTGVYYHGGQQNFTSATYTYSYGFINDRGFHGPVSSPVTVNLSLSQNIQDVALWGFSSGFGPFGGAGGPGNAPLNGFSCPDGFGIGQVTLTDYFASASFSVSNKVAIYRDNGPGTGRYLLGYCGNLDQYSSASLSPFGGAGVFFDNADTTSSFPEPTNIFATLAPQFIEIFNNQLFMCGFSQAPSTVQFSDIGEPESIQPENNFDVRTNDGDFVTGLKSAFSQLFFFKNKSFHVLQGTDPTNFVLSPITDQYGCLSNRAIATYQNYLMFLDKKGICLYNGAQVQVASSKIDPIFAQMNLAAAQNNAWMIHNKDRNQIWCGIPWNGSTLINRVIVYDYLINAWTHFDGFNIASAVMAFGSLPKSTAYFGGYSSGLGYFGTSLNGDIAAPGGTIILDAQCRFISDMGQSVEKMWRRLFMNTISANGATSIWLISLYANYASLPSLTFFQGGQSFQSRSDFGISSKSLSVRFTTGTSSDLLQLQGFSVESRFQRNQ